MLDQMIYLIYWYGSKNDSDFYGFVSKSNFFTYKQEKAKGEKGLHVLPAKFREKMKDTETKLTPGDEDMIRTYQELEEDLLKDPSDRKRGVISFIEGYEMLSYDDLEEMDVDESSSESSSSDSNDDNDEGDKVQQSKKPKAIPKKSTKVDTMANKKEQKKQAKKALSDDIESPLSKGIKNDDVDNHDPSAGKIPVKAKLEKKKRIRDSFEAEDSLITVTSEKKKKPKKESANVDSTKKSSSVPLAQISDSAAVLSDGIGENDEDDEDDIDDKSNGDESSAEMEHEDDIDDDKDDLDFVENVATSYKPAKVKQAKQKKVVAAKKVQKVKTKITLPKSEKQLKRQETEAFRSNEEGYSRLIRKWESAIKSENIDRLRRVLTEADNVVDNFCSSFIVSYNLSTLIKDTKQVLKNANEDLTRFTALKEKFKATFETKRLLVPKGYVPPKRSFISASVKPESTKSHENSNIDVSDHGKPNTKTISDTTQPESVRSSISKGISSSSAGATNIMSVVRPIAPTSTSTVPKFKSLLGNIMQQQRQGLTPSQSSSNLGDTAKPAVSTSNSEQVPAWASASATTTIARSYQKEYSNFISTWESVIKSEDVDRLRRVLAEASIVVGNLSTKYVIRTDFTALLEDSKQVLKNANEDLAQFTAIEETCKAAFETGCQKEYSNFLTKWESAIKCEDIVRLRQVLVEANIVVGNLSYVYMKSNDFTTLLEDSKQALKNANEDLTQCTALEETYKAALETERLLVLPELTKSHDSSSIDIPGHGKAKTSTVCDTTQPESVKSSSSKGISLRVPQDDDTRSLALEFLTQMTQQFPEDLVNVDAMALALEDAIYQWAQNDSNQTAQVSVASGVEESDTSWEKTYWRKVHAIVAAFCGSKAEKGTFYAMMLQGKFDTPDKIVNVSYDKYVAAFEGKALML